MDGPLVILCPTEVERRAIARRLAGTNVTIARSGTGRSNVEAAVDRAVAGDPSGIVIAGVAGGLTDSVVAPPIVGVRDLNGREWEPPLRIGAAEPPAVVLGVDEPVFEPRRKRELASAHGASLVDCESHIVAERLDGSGIPWGVVRGVSDGPDDELPRRVAGWIGEDGGVRPARIALDMAMRPSLIASANTLRARSNRALRAVGDALAGLVETGAPA